MDIKYFDRIKNRWFFSWFFFWFIGLNIAAEALQHYLDWEPDTTMLFFGITFSFLFLMWVVSSFKEGNIKMCAILGTKVKHWKPLIYFIPVQLLFMFFSTILVMAMTSFIPSVDNGESMPNMDVFYFYLSVFGSVILGPISEELVFRGYLFNKWAETMGIGKAMFLSSLLFGVLHFDTLIFPQFLNGLLYSIAYMKTRKLVIPMILHAINNGIVSVSEYYDRVTDSTAYSYTDGASNFPLVELIPFVLLLPVVIVILYKLYARSGKTPPYHSNLRLTEN